MAKMGGRKNCSVSFLIMNKPMINEFKWKHFVPEIILCTVKNYDFEVYF